MIFMRKLIVLLVVFSMNFGYSQSNLNAYKYIIVPKKFDAFKKVNQFKTSTLVKYLFTQEGFNAVYDDALPPELERNRCLGLLVFVNEDSNMFTTKTTLVLKDCSSREVLATKQGVSKKKDFEDAYKEALTEAFSTIKAMNYQYVPSNREEVSPSVAVLPAKDKKLPKNRVDAVVVQQEATPEKQSYKSKEPVPLEVKKAGPENPGDHNDWGILYAQEIANGYQLVDSTPKIRLKIYRTSVPDVFTVTYDKDTNGIVFKKNGKWFLEYRSNGQVKTEELNIKF